MATQKNKRYLYHTHGGVVPILLSETCVAIMNNSPKLRHFGHAEFKANPHFKYVKLPNRSSLQLRLYTE